jgi:hypothetical protein
MPFYFKKALGEKAKDINDEKISLLSLYNIYFWNAFIIYDNFWDEDEEADIKLLPVANYFSRNFIRYFSTKRNKKFRSFFLSLMNNLDGANFNEITNFRLIIKDNELYIPKKIPDYQDYELKFWPSAGHIIAPVLMLTELGYEIDSPEISYLTDYFKHYLVAKQINDDLHDWIEDMNRGHSTIVILTIIKKWIEIYPNKKKINTKKDLPKLKNIFWQSIDEIIAIALDHLKKSKHYLNKMETIENTKYLKQFIEIEEKAIKKAADEKSKSVKFMNDRFGKNHLLAISGNSIVN